jgi:murein DD-endopeptidase MepM/ murein hydrolase activator NlpD
MRKIRGTLLTLLAQQSGQIQLLIVAPILTLSFLSLIVRTASSAVDSSQEKRKVTEQLKRRLSEVQTEKQALASQETKRPSEVKSQAKNEQLPLLSLQKTLNIPLRQVTKAQISKIATSKLQDSKLQVSSYSIAQQLMLPLQASITVGKKMSLATLLRDEGLNREESSVWLRAAKKQRILQKLATGRIVELSFIRSKKDNDRELNLLSYEVDQRTTLFLEKRTDGKVVFRKETLPVSLVWKGIGGRISGSLYKSAIKAGLPKGLVDDLADLDWDIDLSSDLYQGDKFKIIFEEFQVKGKPIKTGRLLAAEVENRGKSYNAFSFPEPQSIVILASGSRTNGTFLRYPLQFTRITSVFTDARLHPILERVRPHTGVDFSAPRGTPVRSIADGTVTFAGRQSGYGLIVRVDHPGPYESAYAHLDRIAKEVTEDVEVEKGQVIGFVGSTGLATGPHLHFEMYKNGEFINPLTAKLDTEDPLLRKENPAFLAKKQRALQQLGAMHIGDQPIVLSMAFNAQNDQPSSRKARDNAQGERFALATSQKTPSLIPGLSDVQEKTLRKRSSVSKHASRTQGGRHSFTSSSRKEVVLQSRKGTSQKQHQESVKRTKVRGVRTARR